jgi:hypothetical protein
VPPALAPDGGGFLGDLDGLHVDTRPYAARSGWLAVAAALRARLLLSARLAM